MDKYQCHQIIEAGKIESCRMWGESSPVDLYLAGGVHVRVNYESFELMKNSAKPADVVGGYFVIVDTIHETWVSANAFEKIYTRIDQRGRG